MKIVLLGYHRGWVARTPPRPGREATRGDLRDEMQVISRFWGGQRMRNSPSCSFGTRRQWPPGHPAVSAGHSQCYLFERAGIELL